MTVEQNVLQQHCEKHQQTLLNQLREITGSTDVRILQQALQVSNGDLGEAVAFLTERNSESPQQNEATYYQTAQTGNDRHVNVGSQAHANVIDLTGDDKEDLQRAIALSLEESCRTFQETGITDEEQAISRVLEASIAENKGSLTSTHMEVWSDPPNPHDRKRLENCPVGLKNVGNTCWFSAVIQSLFHLLEFQRLVLQYPPPANTQDLACNQKEPRNLPFMQELRCLFSLMVGSKRRYVDPSRAVEILKGAFKSTDSQQFLVSHGIILVNDKNTRQGYVFQQQDVSEFSHKLLDWLEDAFQMKAEEEREGEQPKNPMVELFYGRFVAVGVLEGKKFENTETFGQYPLQVNGYKDLHESLEAAMIEGEIESLHSEKPGVSGQEHWFAELPPVLTFELSRFQFNQALGRPEKIHNKLEFPAVLYLDRYLNRNRDITRVKRREMRRLKEHLLLLQQRLERYLSYGSGPKRCPLADVLEYTMEFASSQPILSSPLRPADATGTQPGGTAAPPQPAQSMADQGSPNSTEGSVSAPIPQQRVPVHKPLTQSRVLPNPLGQLGPRFITEEELRVLEGCLQRWRSEVEKDTWELQGCISRIHTAMELMYSDNTLMQVPYRLHAVLVHEGQASAGHYWAYIFSPQLRHWLKFNDVSVTKSTWEELVRDSFGGYRNASAYCLMYVDDKKPFLVQEKFDKETGQVLSGLDKLPADLKEYVKEDNRLFEKELREWDTLQARRAALEKLASAMAGTSTESEAAQPDSREPSPPESAACRQESEYMEQGSRAGDQECWREDTERAVSQAAAQQEQCGPEGLLNALNSERPPSNRQPKAVVDQAFEMAASPQPKEKGSISSLPVDHHVGEGSAALQTADRFMVGTVTPCSREAPYLPVLSIQVGVDKKNTMEILVQGLVKGSTPPSSYGQPVVGKPQSPTPHGIVNETAAVLSYAQPVTGGPICLSLHAKQMAETLTAPPFVKPVAGSPEAPLSPIELEAQDTKVLPPPVQPVAEGTETSPLPVKHTAKGSEAPPPPIKPVSEGTEASSLPEQCTTECPEAMPPHLAPVIQAFTTPPCPVCPMTESSPTPLPPVHPMMESSKAPPLPVKPKAVGHKVPPLTVLPMTEGFKAPPPTAEPKAENYEAPPPGIHPKIEGSKTPPPAVNLNAEGYEAPAPVVQPMKEGSKAPPPVVKPKAKGYEIPYPNVQPKTKRSKTQPPSVKPNAEGYEAPPPVVQSVTKGSKAPPPSAEPKAENYEAPPPGIHPKIEGSKAPPPVVNLNTEGYEAPPPVVQPVTEGSKAPPPTAEPKAENYEAPPPGIYPKMEGSKAPPPVVNLNTEGYEAPPPVVQPVTEGSKAPPPTAEPKAENHEAPPPGIHPKIEGSKAPPPVVNLNTEGYEAPPPVVQPVTEGSKAPPPTAEPKAENHEAPPPGIHPKIEGSKAPPPVVNLNTEGYEAPPPVVQPVTEGSKAPPPTAEPKAENHEAPPPGIHPKMEGSKAPPPVVNLNTEGYEAPPPVVRPVTEGPKAPPHPVNPRTEDSKAHPAQSMAKGFPTPSPPAERGREGAVPHAGTIIQSQEGSYDDEAMLTPSMQSVIRAIGKAWSVYDKCGPEAAFFKAIKLEYGRLLWLARQDTSPENDPRLLYVMVYLIRNQAPRTILERTLLTQFADRSLSLNEQCKNIMKVAQEKLHLIRPEEVNLEEYETWHRDYHNFRETTVFLMIGLELFQKESYVEALMYLIYSYQYNKKLLSRGPYRGHDKELIAHYRRECLLRLNEHAAALFQSGEEPELSDGMTIMNELVVPCLPLLLADEEQAEERNMATVEDIRNRWCSYLGQEMEPKLQETLTDFLPKLLDCSVETRSFRDPPRLPSLSTPELCERFSRVLTSLKQTSANER